MKIHWSSKIRQRSLTDFAAWRSLLEGRKAVQGGNPNS